jgi:ABC-type amino acid transport substrate-binding protein
MDWRGADGRAKLASASQRPGWVATTTHGKAAMRIEKTLAAAVCFAALAARAAAAEGGGDLDAVRERGVLRHLGIPYASFVTGGGDGFDVELMRGFAKQLGVRYEYVQTDWPVVLADLTGRKVSPAATDLRAAAPAPVRGDVVATGMTKLPWREKVASFSAPYFPTQVWVLARADSAVRPIAPGATVEDDIAAVKARLAGRTLLAVPNTCLEPTLYRLAETRAKVVLKNLKLDEVAPALIEGSAELTLLDVADAMIALRKWPGAVKVIGPISPRQEMAVAFARTAPALRAAFDAYLADARRDGTYDRLVKAYFPEAPAYFPEFFRRPPPDLQ